MAVAALSLAAPAAAIAAPPDLSTYVRVGRFDLPAAAQEASAVTYDAARDSLFVVGDGATSVVQISKTGQLIDTMALSGFDDTEGITSIGGGQFVVAEERERRVSRITYQGGGTATRTGSVKLGTTIGNTGIEGLAADPTGGFVLVKESGPLGIFRTEIDWAAGTATNGSPTTENSTNLFDPALAGVTDFADVYATADALLVISQESGRIVNLTRTGQIASALTIGVANDGHEGITMDGAGRIYVVNETGSATATPQLWVYAPSSTPNQPPTAVALTNQVTSVPAGGRVKVADVTVTDDGIGTNALSASGAAFEVDATGLYLKAGTAPGNHTTTVAVDDVSVGATPDATSAPLTVTVTAAPAPATLIVSELSPWSSGNSPYEADWFEVTNKGTQPVDLTGYKVDDSSNNIATAIALLGVGSLAPGKSALFVEGNAAVAEELRRPLGPAGEPADRQLQRRRDRPQHGRRRRQPLRRRRQPRLRRHLRRLHDRLHVRQLRRCRGGHGAQRRGPQRGLHRRRRDRLAGRRRPVAGRLRGRAVEQRRQPGRRGLDRAHQHLRAPRRHHGLQDRRQLEQLHDGDRPQRRHHDRRRRVGDLPRGPADRREHVQGGLVRRERPCRPAGRHLHRRRHRPLAPTATP